MGPEMAGGPVTREKSIHTCMQIVISCDSHLLLLLFTSTLCYSIDSDVSCVFGLCNKKSDSNSADNS